MSNSIVKAILSLLVGLLIFSSQLLHGAQERSKSMKTLVVYYSYSGMTELVAKSMAAELKGDILKIEDVTKLSKLKVYVSGAFAARKGSSWPIKPIPVDLGNYTRIFIGAPIWWGRVAPEINAFIDQVNLTGKAVIVFVTMGGSNPEEALKALAARAEAKGGKVVSSFSVKTGGAKKEEVAAKAKEIAQKYKE